MKEITAVPIIQMRDVWLKIPVNTREVRTLKKTLIRSLTGGAFQKTAQGTKVEALRGINCTINHGERVALIGHNGAGKSSFLRLVSGIYEATSGEIKTTCPIYPMINKSFITGPELSGIQAVKGHYLLMNGDLKGFGDYLRNIVDFSELGDFIHLPMKRYSEGMTSRLLFALLTSGNHDCLALDEGFGTGDARFFRKAQHRLEGFIRATGTLILASHSDELLKSFCNRGIVFNQGKIVFDGPLEDSLNYYHAQSI